MTRRATKPAEAYPAFRQIDGTHPLKSAARNAYVDYAVRRRRGGGVAYFNFGLAREMGLILRDHPDRLNPDLRHALLERFALVIVNEHDLLTRRPIPQRDLLPERHMATRYLQLQHPGRRGRTSGDGRSIWNGTVRHRGITWDISSCGTGVTCLCPATAQNKEFYGIDHESAPIHQRSQRLARSYHTTLRDGLGTTTSQPASTSFGRQGHSWRP